MDSGKNLRWCGLPVGRFLGVALAVGLMAAPALCFAQSPVVPDIGLEPSDLSTFITEVATKLGSYILGTLGVFFAILAFALGIKWIRKMVGGRA